MYFKFLTVAACLALRVAGKFNFTMPVAGITFQAGQPFTITWDGAENPNENIHLSLVAGDKGNLQKIQDLGDAHLGDKSITINIPDTVETNTDYSIRGDSANEENYSHPLSIQGGPNAQPRPKLPETVKDSESDKEKDNSASSTADKNSSSEKPDKTSTKSSTTSSNPASFGSMTVPSSLSLIALLTYFL